MTEDEKEGEMDKLFTLFDRLDRKPKTDSVIPPAKSPEQEFPNVIEDQAAPALIDGFHVDVQGLNVNLSDIGWTCSSEKSPRIDSFSPLPGTPKFPTSNSDSRYDDQTRLSQKVTEWSSHHALALVKLAVNGSTTSSLSAAGDSAQVISISLQETSYPASPASCFSVIRIDTIPQLSLVRSRLKPMVDIFIDADLQAKHSGRLGSVGIFLQCGEVGMTMPIALDPADLSLFSVKDSDWKSDFVDSVTANSSTQTSNALSREMLARLSVAR